ncbi:MAG: hypothetical protein B7Y35_06175 [Sphingomonadales bacterium 28-64-96]|nr:MAG: hypothetical protein B7Y35_06175 [Sphingomonadales bacterium 28-64-96]
MNQAKLIGWAIYAGAALAGLVLLWWVLIGRPEKAAKQVATAKAGQVVSDGRAKTAKDTTRLIERHFTTVREIERNTDAALAEIAAAPDLAGAHDAAARAVCVLAPPPGGAGYSACPLRRSDPGKPES